MAFQLGRVGRTITVLEPETWSASAGIITVSGRVIVSPSSNAVRLRDQFLGYQDNLDEPVVPVVFDGEPRLTGYYRVLSVSVTSDQRMVSTGFLAYQVTLEPVLGFASPAFESLQVGALLTNVVSAAAADQMPFACVPSTATDFLWTTGTDAPNFYTRSSADGNVLWAIVTTVGSQALRLPVRFSIPPASFYVGAATIEQGSVLQPIVGRMFTQADAVNWRLSNGLVRVTPNGSGGFNLSWWNGSSWTATKSFSWSDWFLSTVPTAPNSLLVLRNSTEEVTIRLGGNIPVGGSPYYVDLSLRRGQRFVRGYVTVPAVAGSSRWSIGVTTPEAATAMTWGLAPVTTGGIRATATDAQGVRYVVLYVQRSTTNDLVNGLIKDGGTYGTWDFALGAEVPGAAAAPDDNIYIARQYITAQSESQRVVAR